MNGKRCVQGSNVSELYVAFCVCEAFVEGVCRPFEHNYVLFYLQVQLQTSSIRCVTTCPYRRWRICFLKTMTTFCLI